MSDFVVRTLMAHQYEHGIAAFCTCGWKRQHVGSAAHQHAEHVAALLAEHAPADEGGVV